MSSLRFIYIYICMNPPIVGRARIDNFTSMFKPTVLSQAYASYYCSSTQKPTYLCQAYASLIPSMYEPSQQVELHIVVHLSINLHSQILLFTHRLCVITVYVFVKKTFLCGADASYFSAVNKPTYREVGYKHASQLMLL